MGGRRCRRRIPIPSSRPGEARQVAQLDQLVAGRPLDGRRRWQCPPLDIRIAFMRGMLRSSHRLSRRLGLAQRGSFGTLRGLHDCLKGVLPGKVLCDVLVFVYSTASVLLLQLYCSTLAISVLHGGEMMYLRLRGDSSWKSQPPQ